MAQWIVKIFPMAAVAISVLAYFCPQSLAWGRELIVPLLGVIMLGMGITLTPAEFARAARHPRAVGIGMLLQFLLMPLLAYLIGHALQLPREQFIGVVMVGTVAGGTASNVITYLAGGDVALSITMTACSTTAGIVLTPLLTKLYLGQTVAVPAWAMFQSILLVVALPVALGLVLNRCCRRFPVVPEKISPVVSAVGIVWVIGIIMSLNVGALQESGARVMLAVILHNLLGLGLGYALARLCRMDRRIAITIGIEVGMQNSGLAAALSKQFFGMSCALPGAIFSVWHNLSGAVLAAAAKRWILPGERR